MASTTSLLATTICCMAGAAIIYSAFSTKSPQTPQAGDHAPPFLETNSFGIREKVFSIPTTYDITTGGNYDVGDMKTELFSFTRETHLISGKYLGHINTKLLSWGYDMIVYDENNNVLATVDHKLGESFMNFGGFVMDIKDPQGKTVGMLKEDPFAIWNSNNWRYFDIKNPRTGEVEAQIECISFIPDTYQVRNKTKRIDNRVLAGIVGILDQIEDEENSSDDDDDSSSDD
jgi:hypothetical protein